MATIGYEEVVKTARLSKLPLSKEEIETYTTQLSAVVLYIDKLAEVEEKLKGEKQAPANINQTRDDLVVDDFILETDEALSGSNSVYKGLFEVDYVFSSNE